LQSYSLRTASDAYASIKLNNRDGAIPYFVFDPPAQLSGWTDDGTTVTTTRTVSVGSTVQAQNLPLSVTAAPYNVVADAITAQDTGIAAAAAAAYATHRALYFPPTSACYKI